MRDVASDFRTARRGAVDIMWQMSPDEEHNNSAAAGPPSSHQSLGTSASLMSFSLAALAAHQSSTSLGCRSNSVGTLHRRASASAAAMHSNGDFGHPPGGGRSNSSATMNATFRIVEGRSYFSQPHGGGGATDHAPAQGHGHNPFLAHPKINMVLAAAHQQQLRGVVASGAPPLRHPLLRPPPARCRSPAAPPPPRRAGAPTPPPQAIGPSELYRLIAAPHPAHRDWDAVLRRAQSHPNEACFFDPNAGGHVYALHRVLRRTPAGGRDAEDGAAAPAATGGRRGRPPVAVVEAVIQACPRAMTRKQAVVDEDNILATAHAAPAADWPPRPPPRPPHDPPRHGPPPPPHDHHDHHDEDEEDEEDAEPPEEDHPNDRFEYPLAIACECEQDGEVVRLLASYLSTTLPVYRSEVFRSLDYASLSPALVRILLEEYAGCVLERGVNSEATEGDDDDCPLEQVLFWWDDPDMMGMEDDIANYPNCAMHTTLSSLWEMLRMMLYAATMGTMDGYDASKSTFQVLHRLLRIVNEGGIQGVKFPNDFAHAALLLARFIGRENAGMFEERDEGGSLPLHIAVSGKGFLRESCGEGGYGTRMERSGEEEAAAAAGNDQNSHNHETANQEEGEGEEAMGEVMVPPPPLLQQHNGPLLLPPQQDLQDGNAALPPAQQADQEDQAPPPGEENSDDEDDSANEEDQDLDNSTNMLSSDMETIRLLVHQHPSSIRLRDSLTGSLPIHLTLQHNPRAVEVILHLLSLYPRCVTLPDGNGRLPLHTALLKESPAWERVLELSPRTLEVRDPVTGLLPFMLAAVSKTPLPSEKDATSEGNDNTDHGGKMGQVPKKEVDPGQQAQAADIDSLTTTYRLLRRSPNLAAGLGDVKPRPRSLIEQQIMVSYKPRVVKLEEENERLRQKVEELECRLLSMQTVCNSVNSNDDDGGGGESCDPGAPCLKKRKSSNANMC